VRAAIDPPRPGGHAAFHICWYSSQVSARICLYVRPLVSKVTRSIIGYIELWTSVLNFHLRAIVHRDPPLPTYVLVCPVLDVYM
jgi:hypothetical protein